MPEAVAKYWETKNVREVRAVQREILETYFHDMAKHSKAQIQRIHQMWQSIPAQLARENKKFYAYIPKILLLAEIAPIFPYFRPSRRDFKLVSFISLITQMYLLTK